MKRYKLHALQVLIGLFLLNACAEEDLLPKEETAIDGIPTTVKLSFSAVEANRVTTKGSLQDKDEYAVHNLFVYVFKKTTSGGWEQEYADISEFTTVGEGTETNGSVTMNITSGDKKIYAVANVVNNPTLKFSDDPTQVLATLKSANTVELVEGLTAYGMAFVSRDQAGQMMSGMYNADGLATIRPDGTMTEGRITLRHLDSKITFRISSEAGITFVPKEWKVCRAPRLSYVFERAEDAMDEYSQSESYFDMDDYTNFEVLNGVGNDSKGGSFTFYMLENRKTGSEECTAYQERERENKDAGGLNAGYKNVSNDAAYVEMKGTYTETVNGKIRTAEVKYTVHLGYVSAVDGNEQYPDPRDFNNKRNCNYTYNVTVAGVDNIIVEAKADNGHVENQPGAEGDVVEASTYISLDAHYEVRNITFRWANLDESTMSVRIKTPFTDGIEAYSVQDGDNVNLHDYRWVTFVKKENTDASFAAFPNDPKKRLSVVDVLNELKAFKADNSNRQKSRTYTVFINEYYYDEKADWHSFVNQDNREMNILCDTESSPDTESSYTSTSFMLSQRSIKTFYSNEAQTAWGIETQMEGEPYTTQGTVNKDTDPNYGRYNDYKNIGYTQATSWSKYLDLSSNSLKYSSREDYRKLIYACLNRNRDLDGNGLISFNEVRWYLPAINQYTAVWMGKDGLPSDAHFVKNGNAGAYHMQSSNGVMFWAEEGSSTGGGTGTYYRCARNLGMTADDRETAQAPSKLSANNPADYVAYDRNSRTFTLGLMNGRSLREKAVESGELADHNELSSINRPFKRFQVAERPAASGSSAAYTSWNVAVANSPCKGYAENGYKWRLPNQREIALMAGYCGVVQTAPREEKSKGVYYSGDNYFWSGTSSSLANKVGLGYAIANYAYGATSPSAASTIVTIPNNVGRVWCVRDVK